MGADSKTSQDPDLDLVLSEIGHFGPFQIKLFLMIAIPIALSAGYMVEYVFSAAALDYRCRIPGCDVAESTVTYKQPWLAQAIPFKNDDPQKCLRFGRDLEIFEANKDEPTCAVEFFNRNRTEKCSEFVYKTDEENILKEFGIFCEENEYKLALVGTVNNIGRFVFMPITGRLSDKFGRLNVLVIGTVLSGLFGIIKSFSVNYPMYLIFEFFMAGFGSCTFAAAFIFIVEWVSSKNRVRSTTVTSVFHAFGEIFLGFVAMNVRNFRKFQLTLYTPSLLLITYFWFLPESVRWLLATKRLERAEKAIHRASQFNNAVLSEKALEIIRVKCSSTEDSSKNEAAKTIVDDSSNRLSTVLTSGRLLLRLIICSFVWVVCAFVFFGLKLISTQIHGDGNKYVSFMLVGAAEIPGFLSASLLLDRCGRKGTLIGAFLLTGLSIIGSLFVPENNTSIVLALFIVGKGAITCAFSSVYNFTAELWPTSLRNTMMGFCSMIARIGSMLAPLTPLLGHISPEIPFFIFGGVPIFAVLLIFCLPETKNRKLPETLEEAKNIGKTEDTKV